MSKDEQWVPSSADVDPATQPRKLTTAEIEDIVNGFPSVKGADKISARVIRLAIIDKLISQLKVVKINPVFIPRLKETIYTQHFLSLVQPGISLGIDASDAISAGNTQMTLNTHKTAATGKDRASILESMIALVKSVNPKKPNMKIYFKYPFTYDQVYSLKSFFREITIEDLALTSLDAVPSIEILYSATERVHWWKKTCLAIREPRVADADMYDDGEPNVFLRINLDPVKMYLNKLTVEDLVKFLETDNDKSKSRSGVYCVYSPFIWYDPADGPNAQPRGPIIDIYAKKSIYADILRESQKKQDLVDNIDLRLFFFSCTVQPRLKVLKPKEIRNIYELIPIKVNYTAAIISEVVIDNSELDRERVKELKEKYEKQGNKLWVIYYDQQFCKRTGITEKDIETLFAMYNIKFVESFTDPVYPPPAFYRKTRSEILCEKISSETMIDLKKEFAQAQSTEKKREIYTKMRKATFRTGNYPMPKFSVVSVPSTSGKLAPTKIIVEELGIHQQKLDKYIEEQKVKTRKMNIVVPDTNVDKLFIDLNQFVYAETNGSNLVQTFYFPFVDSTLTTTTNVRESGEVHGIEAAKNTYIKQLWDLISSSGTEVAPVYQRLIAEVATMSGIHGYTHYGNIGRSVGPISRATNEQAGKSLIASAISNNIEDIRNPNASVLMGKEIAMGTGSVIADVRTKDIEEFEQKMEEYRKKTGRDKKLKIRGIVSDVRNMATKPQIYVLSASEEDSNISSSVIGSNINLISGSLSGTSGSLGESVRGSTGKLSSAGISLTSGPSRALRNMTFSIKPITRSELLVHNIKNGPNGLLPPPIVSVAIGLPQSLKNRLPYFAQTEFKVLKLDIQKITIDKQQEYEDVQDL